MPEIHVRDGRLYSVATPGVLVRRDELALLTEAGGVAFLLSGNVPGGNDPVVFTLTTDSRLRVDSRPATDEVNLFAGSAWSGAPKLFSGSCW